MSLVRTIHIIYLLAFQLISIIKIISVEITITIILVATIAETYVKMASPAS